MGAQIEKNLWMSTSLAQLINPICLKHAHNVKLLPKQISQGLAHGF
jgi:hypothetical protein